MCFRLWAAAVAGHGARCVRGTSSAAGAPSHAQIRASTMQPQSWPLTGTKRHFISGTCPLKRTPSWKTPQSRCRSRPPLSPSLCRNASKPSPNRKSSVKTKSTTVPVAKRDRWPGNAHIYQFKKTWANWFYIFCSWLRRNSRYGSCLPSWSFTSSGSTASTADAGSSRTKTSTSLVRY